MKNKSSLLKYELYRAFTNPLFYISAIIFNLFCTIQFFVFRNFFAGSFSTDLGLFFSSIPFISILIVPILSLNTNFSKNLIIPFSFFARIFCRFLSLLIQLLVCVFPLIFIPIFINLFGAVDFGQVFTGFFVILLYLSLASSVSVLFFTIFQNSQMISFIFTAVILFFSNFSLFLVEFFSNYSIISVIFKGFSFSWHFNAAQKGLLDSRDIFYFIFLTLIFIFTSFLINEKKLGKKFCKSALIQIFSIYTILIFSLFNSNQYFFRKDFTAQKKFTVSDFSKEILSSSQEKIQISYYLSPILKSLYPNFRDIEDFLKEFSNLKNVNLKIINPDTNQTSALLKNYKIYPQQIQKRGNNKTEYLQVYSAIVLESSKDFQIIPFESSIETLEYDLIFRIQNLIFQNQRTVNVVSGNDFDFNENYSYLKDFLASNGFSVNVLSRESENFYNELCDSSKITLVLGDGNFSYKNCADFESYLLSGNKILFALNPYSVDLNSWNISEIKSKNLIEMIESYGVYFSNGIINDISCARLTMESYETMQGENATPYRKQMNYPFWVELLPQENAKSGLTLFWPCAINFSENAIPLLFSSNLSYLVLPDFENPQKLFETNVFELEKLGFNPKHENYENFLVSVFYNSKINPLYNKSEGQNVQFMLISDPLFCADLMLGYIGENYSQIKNLDFALNSLLKLNGEEKLANLHEKSSNIVNKGFYKITEETKFLKAKTITQIFSFILIPLFYILMFLLFSIIRKNLIHKINGIFKK